MTNLSEATQEVLGKPARSVALHCKEGEVLDGLSSKQQDLLQAMSKVRRLIFMGRLAKAEAKEGSSRFQAQLAQGCTRKSDADPKRVR
jgi:hypothetical protein